MATREERLKDLTDRLETGISEFMNSEGYQNYLRVMSQFHRYSVNNTILIAMQMPEATHVASYTAWQNKFHRQVTRGQKGIQIIAPAPLKRTVEQEKTDPATGEVMRGADGQPEVEEVTRLIPRFKPATVFDISQTVGEPLPELGINELTADVDRYEIFMEAIKSVAPVPIRFDEIRGGAKGYYDNVNKEIVIQSGMGELQTMKTAVHETVHGLLHDRDLMKSEGIEKDKQTIEVEAESSAFVTLSYFGLDTGEDYSFPYISSWSSSLEAKELKASLDTIRKTASELITGIESSMREQIRAMDVDRYEIYQIEDASPIRDGKFMSLEEMNNRGLAIKAANYTLVYTAQLQEGDILDSLYEKFNINHPADFEGHSMSVSDVVMMHRDGKDQYYFVDSMGFKEIPDFLDKEVSKNLSASLAGEASEHPMAFEIDEQKYVMDERYLSIQRTEGGYDYSFYDKDYRLLDGGVLEDPLDGTSVRSTEQAVNEILSEKNLSFEDCGSMEYESFMESVERANEIQAAVQSQREPNVSFYVAECMEYPVLGEYHDGLSLQEAMSLYEQIPADRMNGVKGIGICLDDGSEYAGNVDLMSGGKMDLTAVQMVDHYKDSPVVKKAIEEIRQYYPDGRETIYQPREAAAQDVSQVGTAVVQTAPGNEKAEQGIYGGTLKVTRDPDLSNVHADRPITLSVQAGLAPSSDQNNSRQNSQRKESVLKSLKERQSQMRNQETKDTARKQQERRKGELSI